MEEDTVVALPRPGSGVMDDPLLAVLREGARRMLTQAIEAEVEAFLAAHAGLVDQQGRRRLVRNGHAPERRLQTGIGPLEVRRPKLRDRGSVADGGPIRFTSAVLPAYLRRTKNIEELLPWLYLKGVSTGQFAEALTALLGPEAPGLSPATVRRLTEGWQDEHERWQRRDLSARRYVYLWADGVYFAPRLEHERQCLLVLIGADASGQEGADRHLGRLSRERRSRGRSCCCTARRDGLKLDPALAIGDGAFGFWKAAAPGLPDTTRSNGAGSTRRRTCSTSCRSVSQPKAKRMLHAIYQAENRAGAEQGVRPLRGDLRGEVPEGGRLLVKDRGVLLSFYDFPAEHWVHIRTTNPIESTCHARPRSPWSSSSPRRPSGTGAGWTARSVSPR